MRWRPLVTQAKNSPSLQPAPCHPLPGTLKQVIAFSHWEISRKWSNLQLEAFAAECFPQLLSLPQLWDRLCSIPWTKCNCPGRNPCLSFPPGAVSQEMLQSITSWFPWAGWALGVSAGLRDGLGEGRERKSWIICTRNYMASTCGVVNFWCGCCPGRVMSLSVSICTFLYLSVYWLKFLKMTEQQMDKCGILFSISLHPYFMENPVFFQIHEHLVKHCMETVSQHSPCETFHFQIYLLPELGSCTVVPQTVSTAEITNVISSSASCVMGRHEQMF